MISFIGLLIIYLFVRGLMLNGPQHLREIYGPLFFLILNFLTITTLGFFSSIAKRYWNRPTTFDQNLASNSYSMYLAHYIFVVLFQLILLTFPGIPGLLKFCIVSILSMSCAYVASQWLVRPFPRISIFATITLFIVMVLLIHP